MHGSFNGVNQLAAIAISFGAFAEHWDGLTEEDREILRARPAFATVMGFNADTHDAHEMRERVQLSVWQRGLQRVYLDPFVKRIEQILDGAK